MDEKPSEKPSLEEVLKYAEKHVEYYIRKHAALLPDEQQDEIRQECQLRVMEKYEKIDPELGWKSFVQTHCWGCVMDYIRSGTGFEESASEVGEDGSVTLKNRISLAGYDGEEDRDLEQVLGVNGIFLDTPDDASELTMQPDWDLVARLASHDDRVHILAKTLLGYTQQSQSENFDVSRERLSQRIKELFDDLMDPAKESLRTVDQYIYAFGLSERFKMKEEDNGVGRDWPAVNLHSPTSKQEIEDLINPKVIETKKYEKPVDQERVKLAEKFVKKREKQELREHMQVPLF